MKTPLYLPGLFLLLSCGQSKEPAAKKPLSDSSIMIDYKMSTYKLFMGQSLDSMQKVFDYHRDYMRDSKDTSLSYYMTTMEPLLQFNNTDFLPFLSFGIIGQKMVKFECSIIASTESHSKTAVLEFLTAIEPLFRNLRSAKNKNELVTMYKLNIDTTNTIEYFSLDTMDRKYDILFRYVKKVK